MAVRRPLTLCLVAALAGVMAAAPPPRKPRGEAAPASDLDPFVGVVKDVQQRKGGVAVLVERDGKGGGMDRVRFDVSAETPITFSDKRVGKPSDLKPGQRVTVRTNSTIRDTCPPQMDAAAVVIAVERQARFRVKSSSNKGGYAIGKQAYTQITVEGTLTDKGGKGRLILDPNEHILGDYGDVIGSTFLALTSFEVKFIPAEKPDSRGPAVYRLEGDKLGEKLSLVVPEQAGRAWRLLITDEKGRPLRVILLEPRVE